MLKCPKLFQQLTRDWLLHKHLVRILLLRSDQLIIIDSAIFKQEDSLSLKLTGRFYSKNVEPTVPIQNLIRQRVDLTNRINNWNDEGREIKKSIEDLEKQQLQLTQELYVRLHSSSQKITI